MSQNVLILERSSSNLKKISKKGKTVLEGIFAEFGIENRNGRIYEEKEYLPHLEYLKKDIANGSLLGELDHPERFEVALGNVSHRIVELWYDSATRQVKGRIELIDTPKGKIAKSLLESGVPLSISSRAAGTVNEDKRVSIGQIYTYDLVAKPGFPNAQLETVNESAKARISSLVESLNESYKAHEDDNISKELGIVNENISIIDVSDKYPSVTLREEATKLLNVKNKNDQKEMKENLKVPGMENTTINEEAIQKWTAFVGKELSKINERMDVLENAILENKGNSGSSEDVTKLKAYVDKIRSIQESALNWQSSIAKGLNFLASHTDTLAEKSNAHYKLTKKIVETVDYNAKTLNHTQDWVAENAKVTNAIGNTVDHNANMLNGINEWNTKLAKGVNALHEWGIEKAEAINEMHDWTSSIAKNLNLTANWSEEMFGRALDKEGAARLVEYIEAVAENKPTEETKKKINEMLSKSELSGQKLNENMITPISGVKGLGIISDVKITGNSKVNVDAGKDSGVSFDDKSKTIVAKMKGGKSIKGSIPKGLKTLDATSKSGSKLGKTKVKGIMTLDTTKGKSKPTVKITGDGPTAKAVKDQNLKLNVKAGDATKKMNEKFDVSKSIKERSNKLDEKLTSIITNIEKDKKVDEEIKQKYPFAQLLGESDRKKFGALAEDERNLIANEVVKNPTTDSKVIKKLWENVLTESTGSDETPLWLKAAPKKYTELYEKASDIEKASINARAEFYDLNTEYQINNFWENSGLNENKIENINEVITAKTPDEQEKKMDSFVTSVANQMKKYNN